MTECSCPSQGAIKTRRHGASELSLQHENDTSVGDSTYGGQDPNNGVLILVKCNPRVANVATKEAKENRIGASPAIRWWRRCMRVAVCLFIDQRELLGGHSGVEAGGRKGRGSDDKSSGAQLPKSKASVRKEVDSEEHHSAAEADLPITKEGM
ncbi:hypothetical protein GW17_00046033 [Ensete ventricosum]|nr:hypothetical protein GW17_00046033 [Ensete ventricosum]